jgi:hypothetical protein
MKTVYKILTPSLTSIANYLPSFPSEFSVQYRANEFVCGRGDSKLFCFSTIEDCHKYIAALKLKKWYKGQKFMIWTADATEVTKKNRFISFRKRNRGFFSSLFDNFWTNHSKVRTGTPTRKVMFAAKTICVRELIEIL